MRNLLLLIYVIILICACSSNENDDPGNIDPPNPRDEFMKGWDLSPVDTIGLRIFGCVLSYSPLGGLIGTEEDVSQVLLGNKNGYLWVHFVKESSNGFSKIKTIVSKEKFNDSQILDVGYGEIQTNSVNYATYENLIYEWYDIIFHDYDHFAITRMDHAKGYLNWIFSNGKVIDYPCRLWGKLYIGYYGFIANKSSFVLNEEGNFLYNYRGYKDNLINYYQYYSVQNKDNGCIIELRDATKSFNENLIWTHYEELGTVIEGHDPRIDYIIEKREDVLHCVLEATNYDGTKEEKIIKLNLENGTLVD